MTASKKGKTDSLRHRLARRLRELREARVWSWEGRAFGDSAPNQDPDGNGQATKINLWYGNGYRDQESGLIYGGARYWDPKLGRSITPDRMSVAEHVERWRGNCGVPDEPSLEINPFVYVLNNPLKWIDADGLAATRAPTRGGGRGGSRGPLEPARNNKASAWADYFGDLGELWGQPKTKLNRPCLQWDCGEGMCRVDDTNAVPVGQSPAGCRCTEYAPLKVE